MSPDLPPPRLAGSGRLVITMLPDRQGLRLCGEADLLSRDALREAIAALPPQADRIDLQLAALDFIDVAAARELVVPTTRPGRPTVILHYPPPVLLRLIRLLWPDAMPGFRIAARDGASTGTTARPGVNGRRTGGSSGSRHTAS